MEGEDYKGPGFDTWEQIYDWMWKGCILLKKGSSGCVRSMVRS